MNRRHWQDVKALLAELLDREPSERAEFLARAYSEDPSVADEVRDLLAHHREAESLFDRPLVDLRREINSETETVTVDAEPTFVTQRVGPYRLLRKVGEGGMGVVYEAEQDHPIRRTVAVKLIKWGMDSRSVVARFESEHQALALMNHPCIAAVHDAGTTEAGQPFFVMEYVQGVPVTEYCDRERLTIRERLELFIEICDGVRHAHQKGIIHRDLQPSNLLVAIRDGKPAPKIIDFGIAKAISQRLTEKTVATELGQLIGTPEYMSPEQAEMTNLDIDTRSDVYSLGVVLYELLVGAHPLDSDALRAGGFDELRRRIREEDSPMPSARLSRLGGRAEEAATRRRSELSALKREIAGDLDWIAMKALEKDRSRRYGSPAELAADIRRYFGDEPVVARPPGAMYRARKFVRRHRVGVAASAAAALVLVAFSATTAVQSRRVASQRDRAEKEAAKSAAVLDFFQETLASADPNQGLGREVTVIEALEKASESVATSFPERPEIRGAVESTLGHTHLQLGRLDDAERWLEGALETLEGEPEAEPRDVATTRFELARVRNLKRRYDEAEPLALSAMEAQRAVLGPRHPDVAHSLSLLAEIARWRGDLEKAEALFREALAIRREHFASAHPDLVNGMNGLAIVLRRRDKLDEAEALYREALSMARELYGNDHMEVATTLSNLAVLLDTKGESSELLHREALAIRTKNLGESHYMVANSMLNLAVSLEHAGKVDEVEPLYRRALELNRGNFGDEHARVAQNLRNLGVFFKNQRRFDEAEPLLREALAMRIRLFGRENDDVANSLMTISNLEAERGRSSEAEKLAREALEIYRTALPEGHRDVGICLAGLASALRDQKRCAEAEPVYREAARILGDASHGGWRARTKSTFSACLTELGNFAEAEALGLSALEELSRSKGESHEWTRQAAAGLVDLYEAWDRPERSAPYRQLAGDARP